MADDPRHNEELKVHYYKYKVPELILPGSPPLGEAHRRHSAGAESSPRPLAAARGAVSPRRSRGGGGGHEPRERALKGGAPPRSEHIVTPGYGGHLPGDQTRVGSPPAFHRPRYAARHVSPNINVAPRSSRTHADSPWKSSVGGITIGYAGHVPNGSVHVGSSTCGDTRKCPSLAQRDHERPEVFTSATSPFVRGEATRLSAASVIGYSGHIPGRAANHSTSFWRPAQHAAELRHDTSGAAPHYAPAHERERGWRPRSARGASRVSPSRGAITDADELARAICGRHPGASRRLPNPNKDSWDGPSTGPNAGWPYRGRGNLASNELIQHL